MWGRSQRKTRLSWQLLLFCAPLPGLHPAPSRPIQLPEMLPHSCPCGHPMASCWRFSTPCCPTAPALPTLPHPHQSPGPPGGRPAGPSLWVPHPTEAVSPARHSQCHLAALCLEPRKAAKFAVWLSKQWPVELTSRACWASCQASPVNSDMRPKASENDAGLWVHLGSPPP